MLILSLFHRLQKPSSVSLTNLSLPTCLESVFRLILVFASVEIYEYSTHGNTGYPLSLL